MREGRQKDEWFRASALMALLANINRDPEKTSVIYPSVFNPFVSEHEEDEQEHNLNDSNKIQADINIFKEVFIDNYCIAGGQKTHDVKK